MKSKTKSLISDLRAIALVPTVILGISALLITGFTVYASVSAEARDGLKNMAYALYQVCQLTGTGEYGEENGVLTKGGEPFDSDFSIVDHIYGDSNVDATLFYGNKRMLTSIRESDGTRAVGTRAPQEVTKTVLMDGKDYFSDRVSVNGTPYFGYYMPLRNHDGTIVGMVFVGKARVVVLGAIVRAILLIFVVVALVGAAASAIAMIYARKIIYSLNKTKEFLGTVAQGNVETTIDPYLLRRGDEIGEMGRFAFILQQSITDLVGTDPLTGLYNRRSCGMILANTVREYQCYQTPFVLAMGDIDGFKAVNDQYGHGVGDMVLRQLAAVFSAHMMRKGYVARWGGEEFLFIYERMDRERAVSYLEELLETIRCTVICCGDQALQVTMTFGVAEFTADMESDTDKAIKLADQNLYYGKTHGKNCVI